MALNNLEPHMAGKLLPFEFLCPPDYVKDMVLV